MRKIFTILFCLSTSILFAQSPTEEMLIKRIEALELRVSILEKNGGNVNSNPAVATSREDCEKWKQIEVGMKKSKVEAILGKPIRVTKSAANIEEWFYNPMSLNGKVLDGSSAIFFQGLRVILFISPDCPH